MDAFRARAAALQLVQDALLSSDRVKRLIRELPVLPKQEVPLEDNCPICLIPFSEILRDEEGGVEKESEGPTEEDKNREQGEAKGVTKFLGCGHIFCRSDLAEWIGTNHLSCPTCRCQIIQNNAPSQAIYGEDDASSDGGEYFPSSEGEEDVDADADVSELAYLPPVPRYDIYRPEWEDEIESVPFADLEMEEREAMMEDESAWIDDFDPEYGDIGIQEELPDMDYEPDPMEDGPLEPDFEYMAEDPGLWGPPDNDPAEEDGPWDPPEVDPADVDGPWDPPEIDPAAEEEGLWDPPEIDPAAEEEGLWDPPEIDPAAEEEGLWDPPELDPAEEEAEGLWSPPDPGFADMEEALDNPSYYDPVMEETSGDIADEPDAALECLDYELDSEPAAEAGFEVDSMDEALGVEEIGEEGAVVDDSVSDSEREELEVELDLTDGESNASALSEDEIRGPELTVYPVSVHVSVDDDSTGAVIISHTYDPQSLK